MITKLRSHLLPSILLIFLYVFNLCFAGTIDTELSRNKVSMGETLTISFILDKSAASNSPDFTPLTKDFRILSKNYGNAINMINGVTTTQSFWRLTVTPKHEGIINVPEIIIGDDKSSPLQLVVEKTPTYDASNQQDAPAFVKAEVSTTSPYVQSQVVYTFKLFYQTKLDNPIIEMPQFKDATLIQLESGKQYQTTVKGKPFYVIEKEFALFPQKAGKFVIPATQFSAISYDFNNSSAYDPFYMPAPKALSLQTADFELNVQPVPPNYEGSTWLPAKDVTIADNWSLNADEWEVGTPVIRTITIEAEGLRSDQIPDLSIDKIPGMTIYTDPAKRSNNVQSKTVVGSLQQKVTYIPTVSQSFTIPAIKINWWNLTSKNNAIAQSSSLVVLPKEAAGNLKDKTTDAPAAPLTADKKISPTEIISKKSSVSFYTSIWFWIATFFFVIWLVTLMVIWRKKSTKNADHSNAFDQENMVKTTQADLKEKDFITACEQGDATIAQQYLLCWAKNQWPDVPMNLERLRDNIDDEQFTKAIVTLEHFIYAKNTGSWSGNLLLAAYTKIKKQRKSFTEKKSKNAKGNHSSTEPLPPLNP